MREADERGRPAALVVDENGRSVTCNRGIMAPWRRHTTRAEE